jgi:hypothetical protein
MTPLNIHSGPHQCLSCIEFQGVSVHHSLYEALVPVVDFMTHSSMSTTDTHNKEARDTITKKPGIQGIQLQLLLFVGKKERGLGRNVR